MRYQIQNAFTHLGCPGLHNILSIIALTFLTLLLNTVLFNHNFIFDELSLRKTTPSLVAVLNDTVVKDEARVFADQIRKRKDIFNINYISKEENLNRAEKQFGHLGRLIKNGFSGNNPFPASLEIYVNTPDITRKSLEKIAFDIETSDESNDNIEIDDVVLTGQGILSDIYRQTNRTTIASIVICVLITFLLIRSVVFRTGISRDEEIRLLNLIGATTGYLRIPFLVQGIFLGFVGTVAGFTFFYSLYYLFTYQLGVFDFIPYHQLILPYSQLITLVSTGLIIGLIAGVSAFKKYANKYKNRFVSQK